MKRRRESGEESSQPRRSTSCVTFAVRSASNVGPASRRKRARRAPPTWGGERRPVEHFRLLGNYNTRPGYVPGGGGLGKYSDNDAWQDARLDALPRYLIESKDVLDVGCGAGYTSILLAEKFAPASVLGVDIDRSLVTQARARLVERATMLLGREQQRAMQSATSTDALSLADEVAVPVSLCLVQGVAAKAVILSKDVSDATTDGFMPTKPPVGEGESYDTKVSPDTRPLSTSSDPLRRVTFGRCDFMGLESTTEGVALPARAFDVVLCIGMTKWIHLNYGDEGMTRLFSRLVDVLRPGGRLILEVQPWSSYKKRATMTPHVSSIYARIKLHPDRFLQVLLGDGPGGGFAEVEAAFPALASAASVGRTTYSDPRQRLFVLRKAE